MTVVRISDGWAWTIPNLPDFPIEHALAVSCAEVFVYGYVKAHGKVARIRLDSLGLGTPPDEQ